MGQHFRIYSFFLLINFFMDKKNYLPPCISFANAEFNILSTSHMITTGYDKDDTSNEDPDPNRETMFLLEINNNKMNKLYYFRHSEWDIYGNDIIRQHINKAKYFNQEQKKNIIYVFFRNTAYTGAIRIEAVIYPERQQYDLPYYSYKYNFDTNDETDPESISNYKNFLNSLRKECELDSEWAAEDTDFINKVIKIVNDD